uniref:DUF5727 domain-containing protein n=1 Tax=Mesocestoides corti TaxID=53468 RepID=A0A5K3EUZ7_MESCO
MAGLLLLCAALATILQTDAQLHAIPGDTRILKGDVNSSFELKTVLPELYDVVTVGKEEVPLKDGDCSTSHFQCKYSQSVSYHVEVLLTGKISPDLKWIVFKTKNMTFIPITIAVFPNGQWADSTADALVPNASQPFVVLAHKNKLVKLQCTFNGVNPKVQILTSLWGNVVFQTGKDLQAINETEKYPEIIKIGSRKSPSSVTYTTTLKRRFRIDYFGCSDTTNWITYMVEWEKSGFGLIKPTWLCIFLCMVCTVLSTSK